jgi:hypothetical protein
MPEPGLTGPVEKNLKAGIRYYLMEQVVIIKGLISVFQIPVLVDSRSIYIGPDKSLLWLPFSGNYFLPMNILLWRVLRENDG